VDVGWVDICAVGDGVVEGVAVIELEWPGGGSALGAVGFGFVEEAD
jgi:hypothetical protein